MTAKTLTIILIIAIPLTAAAQEVERNDASDATVTLSRQGFLAMTMAGIPISSLVANDVISVDGDAEALNALIALLDNFEFWFNIVTP